MAIIQGTTASTKGNPRPVSKPVAAPASKSVAKPAAKSPAAKPASKGIPGLASPAPMTKPAGGPVYGSAGSGNANKYRPISAPPQYLKPGAQMPLSRSQASGAMNPNVSGYQPVTPPSATSLQQVRALIDAMNNNLSTTGGAVGSDAMRALWSGVGEMGEQGPSKVNPFVIP